MHKAALSTLALDEDVSISAGRYRRTEEALSSSSKRRQKMQGAVLFNNLQRMEYWNKVRQIDVNRIKFVDEKVIKGVPRLVRRDPLTGRADFVFIDPSDTVSAIGFCGVAPTSNPIDYYLHMDKTTDSALFSACVTCSIAKGFLRPWDVLILDNKSIHRSRDVSELEDWLYDTYRIFLVYLPNRSAELNPMKKLWKVVIHRLNHWNMNGPWTPNYAVAAASQSILESFSHADVYEAYRTCGY
jgi:DDE superfamily endonuclease